MRDFIRRRSMESESPPFGPLARHLSLVEYDGDRGRDECGGLTNGGDDDHEYHQILATASEEEERHGYHRGDDFDPPVGGTARRTPSYGRWSVLFVTAASVAASTSIVVSEIVRSGGSNGNPNVYGENKCVPPTESASSDLITSLPGWTDVVDDGGEPRTLPSCQYSGYVKVYEEVTNTTMMVHYYYIESTSDDTDREELPLILWSNGGPGASSMYGMLTEVGPFVVNENSLKTDSYKSSGVPTLFPNPYSWTRLGGVLMFDWPPPVGFSYCSGNVTGDGSSCGDWDDGRMANISFLALKGFLETKFPDLKNRGLFLTGESYAGIYVPKLAQQIVEHDLVDEWNLKGFAVGDPCTGTEVVCGPTIDTTEPFGAYWEYLFMYGHGQFSIKLWNELLDSCGIDHLQYGKAYAARDEKRCAAAQAKVWREVGGYFEYNLYDECFYDEPFATLEADGGGVTTMSPTHPLAIERRRRIKLRRRVAATPLERMNLLASPPLAGAQNDYVCGEGVAQDVWTNQTSVRDALHVDVNSNFFSGDNGVGMNYTLTEKNLLPFYHSVATTTGMRVMVYNGDTDPGLNSFVTQNWTSAVGLEETSEWRPWTLDSCRRMGGYVTEYVGNFSFVTVRGSGHMVPHFKPAAAFELISNYVRGDDFKPYNAKCQHPDVNVLNKI